MKIVSDNRIIFFRNKEVLRIENISGATTLFFTDGKQLNIDESIALLDDHLRGADFVRIHDNHIVNVNYISKISNGPDNSVELTTSDVLPIDSRQKEIIIELLSAHLKKI